MEAEVEKKKRVREGESSVDVYSRNRNSKFFIFTSCSLQRIHRACDIGSCETIYAQVSSGSHEALLCVISHANGICWENWYQLSGQHPNKSNKIAKNRSANDGFVVSATPKPRLTNAYDNIDSSLMNLVLARLFMFYHQSSFNIHYPSALHPHCLFNSIDVYVARAMGLNSSPPSNVLALAYRAMVSSLSLSLDTCLYPMHALDARAPFTRRAIEFIWMRCVFTFRNSKRKSYRCH